MSMRRSTPTRLVIPAIGVDSGLVGLGIQPDGSLEVPSTGFPAGWFTGAPTPGELGPAVIAGHVHWQGRWGVFRRLGTLERGDTVTIDRADGSVAVFRVTRTEQVSKDAFPTKQVYGNIQHAGLRLITCGGLDFLTRTYETNVHRLRRPDPEALLLAGSLVRRRTEPNSLARTHPWRAMLRPTPPATRITWVTDDWNH